MSRNYRDTCFDAFLAAYVECALWSSSDESNEAGGHPMDQNYDADDIAPEAYASMRADCACFIAENLSVLESAIANRKPYDWANAGHDFWLTRNGHGAGFWDRGLGDDGDKLCDLLTRAGQKMGSAMPAISEPVA